MRHGDAQGSARAATDDDATARLAAGRATVAVSRAEGAGRIKTQETLEGIERYNIVPYSNRKRRDKDAGGPGRP
jgi:hypothetical protein